MPSTLPLPTITDLVRAGRGGLRTERDPFGDIHSGSLYDHCLGPTAILFQREATADRDLFRNTYLAEASSDALTTDIEGRFGIERIMDTFGQGTADLVRPNALAGAGTLWTGTRIQVAGTPASVYQVAQDTPVSAAATVLRGVPIQATVLGSGTAVQANAGLSFLDPVYDPRWQPTALRCADGTDFEPAQDYRARALATRLNARNGYLTEMTAVCMAQGAAFVVAFASSYGLAVDDFADDFGINGIYVADANHQTSPALLRSCRVAIDSARVLGADLWVGGIQQSPLHIAAVVNLIDNPGKMNLVPITRAATSALLAAFAPPDAGYVYKLATLSADIVGSDNAIQQVASYTLPAGDSPAIDPSHLPATLTRYTLTSANVQLVFQGPA
jgi:Baseplate J-like protein